MRFAKLLVLNFVVVGLLSASIASAGEPVQVSIPANQPWTDTGVMIEPGDLLQIIATGEINYGGPKCGPNGDLNRRVDHGKLRSVPIGALVGNVGREQFLVGADFSREMTVRGRLELGVVDSGYGDNSGAFRVVISVKLRSSAGAAATGGSSTTGMIAEAVRRAVEAREVTTRRITPDVVLQARDQALPGVVSRLSWDPHSDLAVVDCSIRDRPSASVFTNRDFLEKGRFEWQGRGNPWGASFGRQGFVIAAGHNEDGWLAIISKDQLSKLKEFQFNLWHRALAYELDGETLRVLWKDEGAGNHWKLAAIDVSTTRYDPVIDLGSFDDTKNDYIGFIRLNPQLILLAKDNGSASLVAADTLREIRPLTLAPISRWRLHETSSRLFTARPSDNRIYIYDTSTWAAPRVLEHHRGPIKSLAVSPDGKYLFSASEDYTIAIWDTNKWSVIQSLTPFQAPPAEVTVSPDGRRLVTWQAGSSTVKIYDLGFQFGPNDVVLAPNCDFSEGKPQRGPRPVARVEYDEANHWYKLTVENKGKGECFRLFTVVRNKLDNTINRVLVFGKVDPGQTVSVPMELALPRDFIGGALDVAINFHEGNDSIPAPVEASLDIFQMKVPFVSYSYRIYDDESGNSAGNGDGILQKNETVDIEFTLVNQGRDAIRAGKISVASEVAEGVSVYDPEVAIERLEAGAIKKLRVNMEVKQGVKVREIPLVFKIDDEATAYHRRELITLTVGETLAVKEFPINQWVQVSQAAAIRSGAQASATEIARAEGGQSFFALRQLGDFYEIALDDAKTEKAWIAASAARRLSAEEAGRTRTTGQVVRVYENAPPNVFILSPTEGTSTIDDSIRVVASVFHKDGIESWQVLVNGAPVSTQGGKGVGGVTAAPQAAPGAVPVSVQPGDGGNVSVDLTVPLTAGENRIVVEATARSGLKANSAPRVVVRREGARNVYVLAVGISDYQDPDIPDLKYAEDDARRVAEFYRASGLVRDPSHVRLLVGAGATAQGIGTAIEEHLIRNAVGEGDAVILYYSGHGDEGKHPTRGTEYYLIPRDAQKRNLFSTAIDLERLQRLWEAIRCRTKVFLADSCNSGGFGGLKGDATRDPTQALGEGKVALLASRPGQKAIESDRLRSGIFTHVLLDGLGGRADSNGDGRITVEELKSHLTAQVPALARREGGAQEPYVKIEAAGEVVLGRVNR